MYFYYWLNAHISKLLHNDTLKILFTFAALRSLNYRRMQIDDQLFKFSLFCTCKFPAEELEGVGELGEAIYSTLKRFYLHDSSSKKRKNSNIVFLALYFFLFVYSISSAPFPKYCQHFYHNDRISERSSVLPREVKEKEASIEPLT